MHPNELIRRRNDSVEKEIGSCRAPKDFEYGYTNKTPTEHLANQIWAGHVGTSR